MPEGSQLDHQGLCLRLRGVCATPTRTPFWAFGPWAVACQQREIWNAGALVLPELQLAFTADHETDTRNLIKQPANKAAQAMLNAERNACPPSPPT